MIYANTTIKKCKLNGSAGDVIEEAVNIICNLVDTLDDEELTFLLQSMWINFNEEQVHKFARCHKTIEVNF